VLVTLLDQEKRPPPQRNAFRTDLRDARNRNHKQPLVCATMAICRTALGVAWLNDHLGRSVEMAMLHRPTTTTPLHHALRFPHLVRTDRTITGEAA
jgi:hypothetical protein